MGQQAVEGSRLNATHVKTIDYVRGFAIFLVLFNHCLWSVHGTQALVGWHGWIRCQLPTSWAEVILFPLQFANAGVAVFFVVSGFCIHVSFMGDKDWMNFFIRRFFRIYPPYFFAVILFACLLPNWGGLVNLFDYRGWVHLLSHLFLIQNINPKTYYSINGSFWSLAIEAQLYLLYPMLLFLVAKLNWRRTVCLVAVCEVMLRSISSMADNFAIIPSSLAWVAGASPLTYWCSWSLGAWVGDAFLRRQPLPLRSQSIPFWVLLALLTVFIRPLENFRFLLASVLTATVLSKSLSGTSLLLHLSSHSKNFLALLGKWSYGTYLVHQPLLFLVSWILISEATRVFGWNLGNATDFSHSGLGLRFLISLIALLIVMPFCVIWYYAFERPSITAGKRFIAWLQSVKSSPTRVIK
jgi:peptidoglycan/LPS O-acetylase OafA/YrhL